MVRPLNIRWHLQSQPTVQLVAATGQRKWETLYAASQMIDFDELDVQG